jgi:hypothetical protein
MHSSQLSLLEVEEISGDFQVNLVETLDLLVKALPLSAEVPPAARESQSVHRHEGVIDIALDDLVQSFNGFIEHALDVRASPGVKVARSHVKQ